MQPSLEVEETRGASLSKVWWSYSCGRIHDESKFCMNCGRSVPGVGGVRDVPVFDITILDAGTVGEREKVTTGIWPFTRSRVGRRFMAYISLLNALGEPMSSTGTMYILLKPRYLSGGISLKAEKADQDAIVWAYKHAWDSRHQTKGYCEKINVTREHFQWQQVSYSTDRQLVYRFESKDIVYVDQPVIRKNTWAPPQHYSSSLYLWFVTSEGRIIRHEYTWGVNI